MWEIFGPAFLIVVAMLGIFRMRKAWRMTVAAIPPAPPWWEWGEAMWVATFRINPHGVVFILLVAVWWGAEANGWIDGAFMRWSAGSVFAWMLLGFVVVLWNRPRVLVPPAMRDQPGVIGYRRAVGERNQL